MFDALARAAAILGKRLQQAGCAATNCKPNGCEPHALCTWECKMTIQRGRRAA
jgi:type II secretory pathway component PulJ